MDLLKSFYCSIYVRLAVISARQFHNVLNSVARTSLLRVPSIKSWGPRSLTLMTAPGVLTADTSSKSYGGCDATIFPSGAALLRKECPPNVGAQSSGSQCTWHSFLNEFKVSIHLIVSGVIEDERIGWQVSKTCPSSHHYLAVDIEYEMKDRKRRHPSLLLLKTTNIFWGEKGRWMRYGIQWRLTLNLSE